jgi:Zn-dependent peptidase ImmA (M78 family)/DNA-binding XRE family transcriptional regulator
MQKMQGYHGAMAITSTDLIPRRLKAAREKYCFTQNELSEKLGFNDRQTLAAIEAGQRKLSADELLRAVEVLGVDLEYFTDSFRLVGEGQFSWRACETDANVLTQFEERAGRWIAMYRNLAGLDRITSNPLRSYLPLAVESSYEEAIEAAEALGREWQLDDVPALKLEAAITERLEALVLYVDAPHGISGAACHLPYLNTILINRREPEGRRHYDLAHELFHLLTWDRMPPKHTEGDPPEAGKGKRIEELANNFASALLMPEHALVPRWAARGARDLHAWLNETANELRVSSLALKWRLHQLGWLKSVALERLIDSKLTANGRPVRQQSLPRLFGSKFVTQLQVALAKGDLSVRRASALLGMTIDDLALLLRSYELEVPFDM